MLQKRKQSEGSTSLLLQQKIRKKTNKTKHKNSSQQICDQNPNLQ